ncbi:CPBP family intramembrane glutamic endopeptidase [Granulicoccus phenolivorans]|uniref:CPBP family intramembrane glutamic endopeptidase n=1 Tax=Granulicoccus phenolivorans TaxID=266854 RepID=UPI000401FEB7|nr:CPBP family intramembrane glutamic endopeptidase [Granulicoccus phenolivorans]
MAVSYGFIPPSGIKPAEGADYTQILRTDDMARLRGPMFGLLAFSLYAVIVVAVSSLVRSITRAINDRGLSAEEYNRQASQMMFPEGMLAHHLGIISLIGLSVLLVWGLHRINPGYLASVTGRVRWRYLLACLLISAVVIAAYLGLVPLVTGTPVTIHPQPEFVWFAVVIVLTTPFQSIAEEVFFRGYLLQSLGAAMKTPWFGILTSALLFALAHGVQDPWLFGTRYAFGVLAALLVVRTGGLEAAAAIHVMNNVFTFGQAGLTGTISAVFTVSQVPWYTSVGSVVLFAVMAALCYLVARKMHLQTRVGE